MAMEWNQEEIERRVRLGANRGVLIGAYAVQERGTQLIQEPPKTGRIYPRRGVRHQASAPGEAPASDTGRLAGSSTVIPNQQTVSARINWGTEYAKTLELGGRTYGSILAQHAVKAFQGGKAPSSNPLLERELGTHTLEPRPFARRSLAERKGFIEEAIASEIGKALK